LGCCDSTRRPGSLGTRSAGAGRPSVAGLASAKAAIGALAMQVQAFPLRPGIFRKRQVQAAERHCLALPSRVIPAPGRAPHAVAAHDAAQ
jgi:hypothetical protein